MSDVPEVLQQTKEEAAPAPAVEAKPAPEQETAKVEKHEHKHDGCDCGHDHGHGDDHVQEPEDEPLQEPVLLEDGQWDVYPQDPKKVLKKIIKEGTGDKPRKGCDVRVHYTGTLLDGTQFDSSRGKEKFSFKLGVGNVIKGWDYGVATMKIGEIADFTIAPEYAYGENGSPPIIPASSTLKFNVELFDFYTEPTTTAEKMAFGNERKNAGNEFVKKSQWQDALSEYQSGIVYTKTIEIDSQKLRLEQWPLLNALFLNKALCHLKLLDYMGCVTACDEALQFNQQTAQALTNIFQEREAAEQKEEDAEKKEKMKTEREAEHKVLQGQFNAQNAKALYRRGCSCRALGYFEAAVGDLNGAQGLAPQDKLIREELAKATEQLKKKTDKEKAAFSNMSEKMKAMEEEEARQRAEMDKKFEEQRKKEEEERAKREEEQKKMREEWLKRREELKAKRRAEKIKKLREERKKKAEEEKKNKEEEDKEEKKEEKKEPNPE